jgi:hypothetical protein
VALGASGCSSATWRRDARYGEPPPDALAALQPGASDLGTCLSRLGAPLEVWEEAAGGVALAYGWQRQRSFGLSLSVPLDHGLTASLNLADQHANLRAAVLVFDAHRTLTRVHLGRLDELRPTRRPAHVAAD